MKKYLPIIMSICLLSGHLYAQNAPLSSTEIFQMRQQAEKFLDGYAANVRFLAKQNISVALKKESKEYILRYFADENVQVFNHIAKKQSSITTYLDDLIGLEEADFTLETENAHLGLIQKEKNSYQMKVNIVQSVADKQDMKKKYAQTLAYLLSFTFENKKVRGMKINGIEAGGFPEILRFDDRTREIAALKKGQEITISWVSNLLNEVKIVLLKGNKVEQVIAEKIEMGNEGKGAFKWKVSDNLEKNYQYTLQVSTLDGQRSITTNPFGITGEEKESQTPIVKRAKTDSLEKEPIENNYTTVTERDVAHQVPAPTQTSKAEQNLKVRMAVYNLLETYRDLIKQIGKIETPEEERQELKESLITQYFQKAEKDKSRTVFIFNTIDPTKKTQKEFDSPDDFLNSLMLWYKEGYEYDLDIRNAQFGNIRREQGLVYVQVNLRQTLIGRYLEDVEKSTLRHKLTFFITFKLESTIKADIPTAVVNNPKISKISNAEGAEQDKNRFIPFVKFTEEFANNKDLSIGKQITFPIKWDTNVTDSLKIQLFKDNQLLVKITESAQNEVFYWTPSSDLKAGGGYKLRLMTRNDSVSTESKVFSIIDKKYIRVLYPQAGDSLSKGDVVPITWESNIKGSYKIDLLKGNNIIKSLLTTTNKNAFNWSVPKDSLLSPSYDYQIQISALSDTVKGFSEGSFVISNQPTSPFIRIIKPLAGEGVKRKDKYLINWTHNLGSANFEIMLKQEDKADTVQYINKSLASKDNFLWRVNPKIKEAKNYYIQVKSGKIIGKSNLFAIKRRPPWKWVAIGGTSIVAGLIFYLLPQSGSNALPEVGAPPLGDK